MSKAMQYIKNLEAVGFERNQAEAQVQMLLDTIENLATKGDLKNEFALLRADLDNRFLQIVGQSDSKFAHIDGRFGQFEQRFERRLVEMEFRLITRLGLLIVSTTTIAVSILTWLIKLH